MILRTENEIVASWDDSQVIVTVVCITYNQISYIEKTLKSFLSQITNFRFEILIHDDASTDGTAEKLTEYATKYPNIFKLILQNENQYSKGKLLSVDNIWAHVDSEFVAFCEGDDFWLDPYKLAKQIKAITPDTDFCFHAAMKISESGDDIKPMSLYNQATYTLNEVIPCGGGFIPTASWFIRTKALLDLPSWLTSLLFTDYFIQIWVMRRGGATYIPEVMSAYRTGAVGSFVDAYIDTNKKLIYCDEMFSGLNQLNLALEKMYNNEIASRKKSILKSHIKFFFKRLEFKALYSLFKSYFNK
jgi:glycosyltransferase involved in cell wall biosynthesis